MFILLSIGSNTGEDNIKKAEEKLSSLFSAFHLSRLIQSTPIGLPPEASSFLNAIAVGETNVAYDVLRTEIKLLEQLLGRTKDNTALGIVALDIDILQYGDEVFKHNDWQRPYNKILISEMLSN